MVLARKLSNQMHQATREDFEKKVFSFFAQASEHLPIVFFFSTGLFFSPTGCPLCFPPNSLRFLWACWFISDVHKALKIFTCPPSRLKDYSSETLLLVAAK